MIVSHVMNTGCNHALEEFLVPRSASLMSIEHPLVHTRPSVSSYRVYSKGTLKDSGKKKGSAPLVLQFVIEFWRSIAWILKKHPKADLLVGLNPLNAACGLMLRLIGRVDKVVFYAIDFSPRRFEHPVLNAVYHFVEVLTALFCDATWNLSPQMHEGREGLKYLGRLARRARGRQQTVPMGVNLITTTESRKPFRLGYMGWLVEKQGLHLVVEAMPELAVQFPEIELVVIGEGPYRKSLEELVVRLHVQERVKFLGYVEDHRDVERILTTCSVGLAPYLPMTNTFTAFADPGKIKNYLGAGLPIITTAVPPIAEQIVARGCGVVTEPTSAAVGSAIRTMFENEEGMAQMSIRSAEFGKQFEWSKVFTTALSRLGFAQLDERTSSSESIS